MGLLDGTTHKEYYQGNNFGDYQFISLDDIITQFEIMYVGEDKLINKVKRADIAFHAHRALAELSFDVFKSYKSQQIEVPPSLTMVLPYDYVNYTKISRVEENGIKRVLYPTKYTSNPFQIKQEENGEYSFPTSSNLLINGDFSDNLNGYQYSPNAKTKEGILTFLHKPEIIGDNFHGFSYGVWQEIDVSKVNTVNISADGVAEGVGIVRLGLSTTPGDYNNIGISVTTNGPDFGGIGVTQPASTNSTSDIYLQNAFLEWDGVTSTQTLSNIDVSNYQSIFVLITSNAEFAASGVASIINTIDNISVTNAQAGNFLVHAAADGVSSSTWDSYKSFDSTEDVDDYKYPNRYVDLVNRYGLDTQLAQTNGSFYIDETLGKVHFSSNISGKTVILDYISDSLGTDEEMQVPKLAEDAMYKHILYDLISTRSNIGGGRLAFHKKEKFAAVRKAKLRLSNIKLEELSQILRGQSKHIKH